MKREKVESGVERQILVGLVTSREFLAQAAPTLKTELREVKDNPLFKLVAGWCVDYHESWGKAPGRHVEAVYHAWAEETDDPDLADSVHDLLEEVSEEHVRKGRDLNVPFLLDRLGKLLSKKKLRNLQEELDALLSNGDAKTAAEVVTAYRTIELGQQTGVDMVNDGPAWTRAFSEAAAPVIEMSGAAGTFFNHALTRDSFVVFQAPEKRGKSNWLIEMSVRALMNRRRVAFFEVGDMSEAQVMRRMAARMGGIPRTRGNRSYEYPYGIDSDSSVDGGVFVHKRTVRTSTRLRRRDAVEGVRRFAQAFGVPVVGDDPYFLLSVHPNDTIGVRGIEAVLDRWATEKGFIPDVLVCDYLDLLVADEDKRREEQDEINSVWKGFRRLTQERHLLGLSATQANAASYDAKTQGMRHFSRDKRKLAHVTGMVGLNQTPEEKELDVMRANWIVLRESPFDVNHCLTVAQCLEVGRALAYSAIIKTKDEKEEAE